MVFRRDTIKPRRSWPRRLLIIFNCLLATTLVAGVAGLGYTKWRYGQIDKASFGNILQPSEDSGAPMTVLMVGSDSRANLSPEDRKKYGSVKDTPGLADTIMLLHVDPRTKRASILSIPRDTYLTIYSGEGKSLRRDRINSAFQGAQDAGRHSLVTTIQKNFNIPINHYVQVDFDAFKGIVGAVDGVTIRFDSPVRDKKSGLDVPNAGCVKLTGDQALAYVRSRHYEAYEGGKWVEDPRSDLSRIDRQQEFVRRVLRKAIDKGARNPITLNNLIDAAVKDVLLDDGLTLGDIAKLGRRFQSLDPNDVEMQQLPTSNSSTIIAGMNASIVVYNEDQARKTVDRFLNGPPKEENIQDVPPSSISVRVLNGSGKPGHASSTAADLKDLGFVISGTGDARSFGATQSKVMYASGQQAKADVLAAHLIGAKTVIEDKTLKGVDVVLVTSSGLEGVSAPGKSTSSTVSTEAPKDAPQPSAAPNQSAC